MIMRGDYYFLSNMYPCKISTEYGTFRCAEAYFQAMKCPERAEEFLNINGFNAKKLGRQVPLREDWNKVRLRIMSEVLKAKFDQNPELKAQLLACKDYIQEDNDWGDTFWGMCNGRGKNHLGKQLMFLRDVIYEGGN